MPPAHAAEHYFIYELTVMRLVYEAINRRSNNIETCDITEVNEIDFWGFLLAFHHNQQSRINYNKFKFWSRVIHATQDKSTLAAIKIEEGGFRLGLSHSLGGK